MRKIILMTSAAVIAPIIHRVHAPIITEYAVRGVTNGFVRRPVAKWVLAILAAARGIPAAPEKPVKGNIRHALAVVRMHGMVRLVLVHRHINTPVPAPATPAVLAQPAVANIHHALVQAGINGRTDNVKRRRYGALARVMRHSVHLVISCSATELAARIWYRARLR